MLPASFAACVPVGVHGDADVGLSERGGVVILSPVIATKWPAACSSRIRASFISGVACARKSSTRPRPR